eukprot:TRINITY_DN37535_c0_g1_i1.p1 TRINITY_DN37535_c0_g1~~TRINITY_DN37535_c0_g1_i1.p1  ORF type:complete len:472 (-),score=94.48 TRINITY_DN37535_c0_g1_i1:135-1550(-)
MRRSAASNDTAEASRKHQRRSGIARTAFGLLVAGAAGCVATRLISESESLLGRAAIVPSSRQATQLALPPRSLRSVVNAGASPVHRREMLQMTASGLAIAGAAPSWAEDNMKFQETWSANDGVQFLTVFSEESYGAMRDDSRRTPLFIEAIKQRVSNTPPGSLTVLDIGTGPFALFALVAARAGAKKIYAVEANPEAAARARRYLAEQDDIPDGVVEIIEGFTTAITLPEKVDLCLAEIVGAMGSEENMIQTIKDAQARHMKNPKDPNNFIPVGVQTFGAPVSYALHPILAPPRFERLNGQPLRVNSRDKTMQLLSDPQLIEDIPFYSPTLPNPGRWEPLGKEGKTFIFDQKRLEANEAEYKTALIKEDRNIKPEEATKLAHDAAYSFSGMAFWPKLTLDTEGKIVVESRGPMGEHQKSHWPTVLALMSPRQVPIEAGDSYVIKEAVELNRDIIGPSRYTLDGELIRPRKT